MLNELKEKIQEVVPDIMELKFGCVVFSDKTRTEIYLGKNEEDDESWFFEEDNIQGMDLAYSLNTADYKPKEGKVIGRPITLEDVLRAIENLICKDCKGQGGGLINGGYSECNNCGGDRYDLPEDLIGSGFKLVDVLDMWHLGKPLDLQPQETISFLHSATCK